MSPNLPLCGDSSGLESTFSVTFYINYMHASLRPTYYTQLCSLKVCIVSVFSCQGAQKTLDEKSQNYASHAEHEQGP